MGTIDGLREMAVNLSFINPDSIIVGEITCSQQNNFPAFVSINNYQNQTWNNKAEILKYEDSTHIDNIVFSNDGSTIASIQRIDDPPGGKIIQQLQILKHLDGSYQHIQTIDSLEYHLSLGLCPGSGTTFAFSNDGNVFATIIRSEFRGPTTLTVYDYEQSSNSYLETFRTQSVEDKEGRSSLSISGDGKTIVTGDSERFKRHLITSYTNKDNNGWKWQKELEYESLGGWYPPYSALDYNGNILAVNKQIFPSTEGKAQIEIYNISADEWFIIGEPIVTDLEGKDLEGMLVEDVTLSGDGTKVAFSVGEFSNPDIIDTSGYVGYYEYKDGKWDLRRNFAYATDLPKDHATRPVLDASGSRLAVSDSNGKVYIYDLDETTDSILDSESGIELYPNPFTDRFFLDSSLEFDKLEVYDNLGREVNISGDHHSSGYVLDSSSPGCYYLVITAKGYNRQVHKLLRL